MPQITLFLRPLCLAALLPAAALAQDIQIESQVPGIAGTTVSELPANPTPVDPDDYCIISVAGDPTTPAGEQVAEAGWGVVGELEQSDYTYIGFVGSTETGTSGSCLLDKGNIGIFRDAKIVGLVYGDDKEKTYGVARFNSLESGALRIFDGDYLNVPVADLNHDGNGKFVIGPIAARDAFCGGKVSVPTMYGQSISDARTVLLAEGWTPNAADAETRENWMDYMKDMAAGGLEEIQDCAGTGFGYCNFQYSHDGGFTLDVTTVGEGIDGKGPSIAGFDVVCE